MAEPFSHPSLSLWQARRKQQLLAGKICAFFFLCALLALIDGLQTLLRTDTDEILLMAGQSDGISGPCPLQNPVSTDLEVRFTPADTTLRFELEGFFAGYLIGNGMWRGRLIAPENQASSDVSLVVAFKGTAKGQKFRIHVFANEEDLRAQTPSFILRLFGLQAFVVAGVLALVALLPALVNYALGRNNLKLLQKLRLAEVFRVQSKETDQGQKLLLWCTAKGGEKLRIGENVAVFSTEGKSLGEAAIVSKEKQVFCLRMEPEQAVSAGCLVDLHSRQADL